MRLRLLQCKPATWVPGRGRSAPLPLGSVPSRNCVRPERVDAADPVLDWDPSRSRTGRTVDGYGDVRQWPRMCRFFSESLQHPAAMEDRAGIHASYSCPVLQPILVLYQFLADRRSRIATSRV